MGISYRQIGGYTGISANLSAKGLKEFLKK